MHIKKIYGYVDAVHLLSHSTKGRNDVYDPPTIPSTNYKHWVANLDPKTCFECKSKHGQIYELQEEVVPSPPLHPNCRCEIEVMRAIAAGNATKDGVNGADFWLKYFGRLPDYYVSEQEAKNAGWSRGKPPRRYVPGNMLTRGKYENENGHLPQKPGRIWYEADINYCEGRRNTHRILWSNDGLIFVTYDHYHTFSEIV